MIKKSKIIQELGIEILDSIKEKQKELEQKNHPMNTQYESEEEVAFKRGCIEQTREIWLMLYSSLSLKFNQALAEERIDKAD